MKRPASVDVIVPCYNYGRYLEACVSSILRQSEVLVRALILDDASSDNTEHVAAALCRKDPRVSYRKHPTNIGHILTYNEGLEWVSGDYLLLISADDVLAPDALARAVVFLEQHPDAVFAHGRQIVFERDPPLEADCGMGAGFELRRGRHFIEMCCDSGHNPVATPTVVVRSNVQRQAGGYDPSLPHTADLDMWMRLATYGDVISVSACQAFKRKHACNMQIQYVDSVEKDVAERSKAFEQFFAGSGARFSDCTALHARARHGLAIGSFWEAARAFDLGGERQCARLLAVAVRLDPTIMQMPAWRNLLIKRWLGMGCCKMLRAAARIALPPRKSARNSTWIS